MDDWVVLAPTRWKLRHAVRVVNETLAKLRVQQHPDKTFIGRTERGFAFLGYQMNEAGLTGVAPPTRKRFIERVRQRYEQDAGQPRIGQYVRRWLVWVKSGLTGLHIGNVLARSCVNAEIPSTFPPPHLLLKVMARAPERLWQAIPAVSPDTHSRAMATMG